MASRLRLSKEKDMLPSPPSSEKSFPALRSRFSSDTLSPKTPRLPSFSHHRWFSHSPPASPPPVPPRHHQASASDSILDISGPTAVTRGSPDQEERADGSEEEVLGGVHLVSTIDEAFEHASRNVWSKQQHRVPRPTRPPPLPPTQPPALHIQSEARIPLRDLPPRSDSRTDTTRSDSRNGFLPPKDLVSHIRKRIRSPSPCPASVSNSRTASSSPEDSVPAVVVEVAPLEVYHLPSPAPFKALLLQAPRKVRHSLRVTLDIGGTTFVTSAETLLSERAGKLGEFVGSAMDDARHHARCPGAATATERQAFLRQESDQSLYSPSEMTFEADQRHFELSPYTSPFPFEIKHAASECDSEPDHLSLHVRNSSLFLPSSPTSPIDPIIHSKLFFRRSPSPEELAFTPPGPLLATHGEGYLLVPSPLPSERVNSIHASVHSCASSDSGRSPRAQSSTDNEVTPFFTTVLGPQFEVLPAQQHTSTTKAQVQSFPVGVDTQTEEDKSRSTRLGVPRGGQRWGPRAMRESGTAGSRPPSLTMSFSSTDDDDEEPDHSTMTVFLDRDGDSYGAVLAFLRTGTLPPALAPPLDATSRTLYAFHPPAVLEHLARLRRVEEEATWLGMKELGERCVEERVRVSEMVRAFKEERKQEAREEEARMRKELHRQREKAGWF